MQEVSTFGQIVSNVTPTYVHPIDPDDSHYIDLALAAGASLITSRDRHLLNLMDRAPEGAEFHRRFPFLDIVTPEALLSRIQSGSP